MDENEEEKQDPVMGRPKIEIDRTLFESLCHVLCTEEEIAGEFDCSVTTLWRWCNDTYGETFEKVYKKKSAKGRASLRRMQFRSAQGFIAKETKEYIPPSVTAQIWLGKQLLNQSDKHDLTSGGEPIAPPVIAINVSDQKHADLVKKVMSGDEPPLETMPELPAAENASA